MIWITPIKEVEGGCIVALHPRKLTPFAGDQPRINYKGKRWIQPRLSFCLNVEEIPRTPEVYGEGLVLHSCDHKWCINYEHLSLGTSSENIKHVYERMPNVQEKRLQTIKELYASGQWGTKGFARNKGELL